MKRSELYRIRDMIEKAAAQLDDADALNALELFPKWQCTPPMSYTYGKRVVGADGKLYKCIQPHTSQSDWPPETTTALWVLTSVEEWPEWIQPTGAHDAYPLNAKCSHNGKHWINTGKDGNEYEPGVWGWDEVV